MYDEGADIVYHAAGGSGGGVFDAAAEAGDGNWAIGVDSDQYLTATADGAAVHPDLDAQERRRRDVYNFLKSVADGSPRPATSPTT